MNEATYTIRKKVFRPIISFLKAEQVSGVILIVCTVFSLLAANSRWSEHYLSFWHQYVGFEGFSLSLKLSVEHWINDGLMAVFFLVVGLEIKRELINGELSSFKKASLPLMAAFGGSLVPALLYLFINKGTPTAGGWGIPMATDIAFALGILSLLGKRVPLSLKVFLTALAVVDDLGAIVVIAIFYSHGLVLQNLLIALGVFSALLICNKLKFTNLSIYLLIGVVMWYFMLKSGIHATIAGVLLALAIPMKSEYHDHSPAEYLEHGLHQYSSYLIMPLFALCNTGIVFNMPFKEVYTSSLGIGIILGLLFGKPVGISLFSYLAVKTGMASWPSKINFKKIVGVGFLGGIGFTMSIFISLLAFKEPELQSFAKIAVLVGSLLSGFVGYLLVKVGLKKKEESAYLD
ncbi:Na+/H+ antiporter NhaA [Solitalea koreensis]|uniref:Na(+)/H(+) antiporter NhaA n=1 Tax=Solitalea koreensis TaxID=543615 RepID=A0A521BQL7_9SPHI|nr:Na+/H+ antiporter NhaA [Solitalea koreensis]SMO49345.1 sodium/proton antiporter, NhaA family [Solitalea koreensis]